MLCYCSGPWQSLIKGGPRKLIDAYNIHTYIHTYIHTMAPLNTLCCIAIVRMRLRGKASRATCKVDFARSNQLRFKVTEDFDCVGLLIFTRRVFRALADGLGCRG
eukprot:COSAG01_NODE_1264_length_10990_cov_35.511615_14_plen_105_part_00